MSSEGESRKKRNEIKKYIVELKNDSNNIEFRKICMVKKSVLNKVPFSPACFFLCFRFYDCVF